MVLQWRFTSVAFSSVSTLCISYRDGDADDDDDDDDDDDVDVDVDVYQKYLSGVTEVF